ncbi:MAG: hypothetical protein KAS72_01135 [Phycisphaerales bacterium]|nr:hypothetical protein [Phycisphaerales bacterium]
MNTATQPLRAYDRLRTGLLLVIALAGLVLAGCAPAGGVDRHGGRPGAEPVSLADRLDDAIKRAGDNGTEIEAFLLDQEGDRRTAAEFLVANMPTVDLVSMSRADLQENLKFAFAAREELPWAKDVPFELFLHYVLPHRVTEEKYQSWRPRFYNELSVKLDGCETMVDAAIAVNHWCTQRVGFKPTQRRDQNAISTLKSGIGRCEEMMIVAIDAMRSVGIPARPCSAPWWVVNDNNHAWVEIWADGDWYYLGGCEAKDTLNVAWFSKTSQRAGVVVSWMYGSPEMHSTGEVVCRTYYNSGLINSTAVYAMTDEVTVTVVDEAGLPVADCAVSISGFNYGALRSLLRQKTDSSGRTTFVVGMGEYFVSAGNDAGRAYAIVASAPDADNDVTLTLVADAAPQETFWLHYPTAAEAARMKAIRPSAKKQASAVFKPDLGEPAPRDLYDAEKDPLLEKVLAETERVDQWRAIFTESFANWRQVAAALKAIRPHLRDDVYEFMSRTNRVDRLEIDSETILDHVNWAAAHRLDGMDDELYDAYVLSGRIEYEHLDPWRDRIAAMLADLKRDDPVETAQAVNRYIAENIIDDSDRRMGRSQRMNPIQVLTAGRGSKSEATITAVGVLRVFGIPASKSATRAMVEFHDGTQWRVFDPFDTDSMRIVADEAGQDAEDVEVPGTIELTFTKDGASYTDWDVIQRSVDVAQFKVGSWEALRRIDGGPEDDRLAFTLPADEYLVTAGVRNANGDPYIHTKLVNLEPGQTVSIAWAMDLPADAGVFRFEKVRELAELPPLIVPDAQGELVALADLVEDQAVLLYFFMLGDEPSVRMAQLVNEAAEDDLAAVGVRTIGVLLPCDTEMTVEQVRAEFGLSFPVLLGTDVDMTSWQMPSVLLLNRGGGVVLWIEGYDMKIGDLLRQARRQIR